MTLQNMDKKFDFNNIGSTWLACIVYVKPKDSVEIVMAKIQQRAKDIPQLNQLQLFVFQNLRPVVMNDRFTLDNYEIRTDQKIVFKINITT